MNFQDQVLVCVGSFVKAIIEPLCCLWPISSWCGWCTQLVGCQCFSTSAKPPSVSLWKQSRIGKKEKHSRKHDQSSQTQSQSVNGGVKLGWATAVNFNAHIELILTRI